MDLYSQYIKQSRENTRLMAENSLLLDRIALCCIAFELIIAEGNASEQVRELATTVLKDCRKYITWLEKRQQGNLNVN
nr:MAG TPA: hypothetical protein [Caudoviricetes sp.]